MVKERAGKEAVEGVEVVEVVVERSEVMVEALDARDAGDLGVQRQQGYIWMEGGVAWSELNDGHCEQSKRMTKEFVALRTCG